MPNPELSVFRHWIPASARKIPVIVISENEYEKRRFLFLFIHCSHIEQV